MPTTLLPNRLRPTSVGRAYRRRADGVRARREHDQAIAANPRLEHEHRFQVARSIELGRGGCPYCGD